MRSSMDSSLPVCSPAVTMRIIMEGKIGCLPRAAEIPSPFSISAALLLMAFSMMTLPTVWETICKTSRMGTPLRTREASVRVKRAKQILWAIEPYENLRFNEVIQTGDIRRIFAGHQGGVRCVAISPDGALLVTVGDDQCIHTWDAATGVPLEVYAAGDSLRSAFQDVRSRPAPLYSYSIVSERLLSVV